MSKDIIEKPNRDEEAIDIVGWYTLAASAAGAVPVPASSAAIVANNGFMIAHISSIYATDVSWDTVIASLGIAGTLNIAGRAVFIEAAKTLAWGTGSFWSLAALSAVGATTAALQTYIIGLLAIEIAKKGGTALSASVANTVISKGPTTLKAFLKEAEKKDLNDPGKP